MSSNSEAAKSSSSLSGEVKTWKAEASRILNARLEILTQKQRAYNLDLDNPDCNKIFNNFQSFVKKMEDPNVSEEQHQQNCLRLCLELLEEGLLNPKHYETELLAQFAGLQGGSYDDQISPYLTELLKALFLEGLFNALKAGVSDALKSTPEYQYLLYWIDIRNNLSKAAEALEQTPEYRYWGRRDARDPTLEAWGNLYEAMCSYENAIHNLTNADRRKACEAANDQLKEILPFESVSEKAKVKAFVQSKQVPKNNASARKPDVFQKELETKRAAPTKLSSAFGMLKGAAMMVAGVIAQAFVDMGESFASITQSSPAPVRISLWEEGKELFNQSQKEFEEAPSGDSIKKIEAIDAQLTGLSAAIDRFEPIAVPVEAGGCKPIDAMAQDEKESIAARLVEIPLVLDDSGLPDEKRSALMTKAVGNKGEPERESFTLDEDDEDNLKDLWEEQQKALAVHRELKAIKKAVDAVPEDPNVTASPEHTPGSEQVSVAENPLGWLYHQPSRSTSDVTSIMADSHKTPVPRPGVVGGADRK